MTPPQQATSDRMTSLFQEAIAWQQRGDFVRADATCERLLRESPRHADAWHLRGLIAMQQGQFERGVAFIKHSLEANAGQPAAHANIGTALLQLKRATEALAHFDRASALQAGSAATLYGRASALLQLERFEEALADFDSALQRMPSLAPALCGRGQALEQLKRFDEALTSLDQALALAAEDGDVLFHRGNVLFELRRYEEALASYDGAASAGLVSVELLNNRGNVLRELSRPEEALASYQRALEIEPEQPEAGCNRGNALLDLGRIDEALVCYEAALRKQPDFPAALDNLGLGLLMADRPEDAARSYARLVEITPHDSLARANLHTARRLSCDWTDYEDSRSAALESVEGGRPLHPFPFLAVSDSAAAQLSCARKFVVDKWGDTRETGQVWRRAADRHARLRVAYVSADFREHVVSYLMAGVLEQHDRERVDTIGISLRAEDGSPTGRRMKAACDQFVEVARKSDREVAALLRELGVDIAVDLMGFTRGCRPGIFANRAAPVQVGYLGYPGTSGAPFIDYILADDFVIPPAAQRHYTEQVVYLPECFQANDDRRLVGTTPTRAAVGLPETGLVLCCFNNSYKLNPPLFDIWMRLLLEIPDSVLWVLATRAGTDGNLRREATARGVDAQRLVFAGSLPYAEHLGRLGLADLFLDTLPYNAGATASDALRCGVPVLTCSGEAFAARMAGSLLRAVGLPELITFDLHEYESKALQLVQRPEHLAALRANLAKSLQEAPLFNTARFCRHLEAAYREMNARAVRGDAPSGFRVAPLASPSEAAA